MSEESKKIYANKVYNGLPSNAIDVLEQLFVQGPTWDGYIISKSGRNILVDVELAEHRNGWTFLTASGVDVAIYCDVSQRHDKRWYKKQTSQGM